MTKTKEQIERKRVYNKAYYKKNAKEIQTQQSAYRLANPDVVKRSRKRSQANRRNKVNSDFDTFVKHKYSTQRASAKRRGLAWNLSKQQVYNLFTENKYCNLSGVKVTFAIGDPNQASLDRINNRYGYSIKNVQVVSATANKCRNDLTIKEWDKVCIGRAKQLGYHK